jgi:hypothetical protein
VAWMIIAILVVCATGIVVLGWRALRQRQRPEPRPADDDPPDIFLVVPPGLTRRNGSDGPAPWTGPFPAASPPEGMASPDAGMGPHPGWVSGSGLQQVAGPRPSMSLPYLPGLAPVAQRRAAVNGTHQGPRIESVHYDPPSDGTLHILPGRLEVLGGPDPTKELRFVRLPDRDPVITFGRSDGEPHAHVRLESPTVSRLHAAMRFVGGEWHIENRSQTNPVTVNGIPMSADSGSSVRLVDGDLIEMGAVCLRFRER